VLQPDTRRDIHIIPWLDYAPVLTSES